jgi:hypothetical protein
MSMQLLLTVKSKLIRVARSLRPDHGRDRLRALAGVRATCRKARRSTTSTKHVRSLQAQDLLRPVIRWDSLSAHRPRACRGGLRVSELVGLTWGQVIRRDSGEAQLEVLGKGDKVRQILIAAEIAVRLFASGDAPATAPVFGSIRQPGKPLTERAVNYIRQGRRRARRRQPGCIGALAAARARLACDRLASHSALAITRLNIHNPQLPPPPRAAIPGPRRRSGSVTVIQWFGGGLNLNIHFHTLLFNGVFFAEGPMVLMSPMARKPKDGGCRDVPGQTASGKTRTTSGAV